MNYVPKFYIAVRLHNVTYLINMHDLCIYVLHLFLGV